MPDSRNRSAHRGRVEAEAIFSKCLSTTEILGAATRDTFVVPEPENSSDEVLVPSSRAGCGK